ncbi:HAD family hydrolase [Streptomyces iconiensis]|uniref:HAD family phosphatase n=1 Tax=Streptomyces iconiensis TaxID=1384038 RepID=A0ABT6ZZE8_9ACTN|nr:HAD family phosphatase [Streptomyces iconiensis]MDJ1133783.1 HAD family phosphatase [Streptomyces iconiensis]
MADAVVFDMDGVLVESEHLWEGLWSAFAAERGKQWGPEQTKSCQGMSAPEWAAFLAEFAGAGDSAEAVEHTERTVVDGMVKALDDGEIDLLPGALEMITDSAALGPIALASSAPRRVIDAVLAHHGVDHHFKATVSSAEVPRGKPSPDVYLAAAGKLGVPAADCLAVEDSSNGLRAATAAGMTVVAIPNPTYPPAEDALAGASYRAVDHADVRRYLLSQLKEGGQA